METIQTKTAEFSYIEKDIIQVRLFENARIEIKDVEESFTATMNIAEHKKYAVLVDATPYVYVTPEARIHGARKEFQLNLVAQAIFVTSLANRIVGNFIIRFNKPYAPTKLFSDKESALEWLREQLKRNKADY